MGECVSTINGYEVKDAKARKQLEALYITPQMFGAKGDGVSDDTNAFVEAFANSSIVVVPYTENGYKLKYLNVPEGKTIIGVDKPLIIIDKGDSSALSTFKNNSTVKGLHIKSINDYEWCRIDLTSVNNVNIENCKIEGFKDTSGSLNAWGLYIDKSHHINISNCEFADNSQSDIAITDDVSFITIERCLGEEFYINIEPNSGTVKNIEISNCELNKISLLVNQFSPDIITNTTITNCSINTFWYNGGDVAIINSPIKSIENSQSETIFGGSVKFINSIGMSESLIEDNYLDNVSWKDNSYWVNTYAPNGVGNAISHIKKGNTLLTAINGGANLTSITVKSQKIQVESDTQYLIFLKSFMLYKEQTNFRSICCNVDFYEGETLLNTQKISFNRGAVNSETPLSLQMGVITTPENCTHLVISLYNSSYGNNTLYVEYVSLNKFNENITSELVVAPRLKREFYSDIIPTSNFINYNAGDTFTLKEAIDGVNGGIYKSDGTWLTY